MVRPSLASAALLAALSSSSAFALPDPPRTLSSYALFAIDDVRTKGLEVSGGGIGVNAGSIYAHGPVHAAGQPVVADLVRIHEGSMCAALFGNSVLRNGPDCGPATAFASPILADPAQACGMPANFPVCDPQQAVDVPAGAVRHLAPGTYGAVSVDGGGSPGTLILDGGDYTFCSLEVGRSGQLRAAAMASVAVAGQIIVGPHTVVGPVDGSGLMPSALRLLSNDDAVRFARQSEVHARLCAPQALLRVTAGSMLDGLFVARAVHTEHVTIHGDGRDPRDPGGTTTTTSSTTTTQPGATTTSTTTAGSTTTTTDPCDSPAHCGDGLLNCGEACDPAAPSPCDAGSPGGALTGCLDACATIDRSQCPGGSSTTTSTAPNTTTTTTTTTVAATTTTTTPCANGLCPQQVKEDCGNCTDDDGDGLIDFEDPDCCGTTPVQTAVVHRGRMMPRAGNTSRLVLRTTAGMMPTYTPHPMQQDVTLQIRSKQTGDELFCARIPAMKFMMKGKHKVGFWDYRHHVAAARGVDDMTFRYRKDGAVRVRVLGRRAQFQAQDTDDFMITIGTRDAADPSQNLCSAVVQPFTAHRSRSGRLKSLW